MHHFFNFFMSKDIKMWHDFVAIPFPSVKIFWVIFLQKFDILTCLSCEITQTQLVLMGNICTQ